jgi:protein-tyrosine phosphatase
VTQELPQTDPTGSEPTAPSMTRPGSEPELTGVRNFRDVGGLPTTDGRRVKYGVLFRSGHLAHADADATAFLAGLGLHTVFDFRNRDDIALEGPDVALPGTVNVNLPLSDPAHNNNSDFWRTVRDGDLAELEAVLGHGRAAERMMGSYRKMIRERTAEHARMLELLTEPADPAVPALLHCAAGKDRAGTSIAVILLALGVERSAIEADYLESNAPHRRYRVRRGDGSSGAEIDPAVMALLDPLFEARVEYLRAAFETIEQEWGSVDRYLEEALGLTKERRERLREALLTG